MGTPRILADPHSLLGWEIARRRRTYGRQFPTLWARRQQSGTNLRACPSTPEHTYRRTRGSVPRGAETGRLTGRLPRKGSPLSSWLAAGGLSRTGGRREPAGWGQAVPGDFTLFEARVFRDCRCHSRSFSLLLHWHLPPSPARWTGRPGRGIALRRRPRSAGSRLPGTAAESRGATPPRVSSLGAVRGSAVLSPAVSQLGLLLGRRTPTARHLQ